MLLYVFLISNDIEEYQNSIGYYDVQAIPIEKAYTIYGRYRPDYSNVMYFRVPDRDKLMPLLKDDNNGKIRLWDCNMDYFDVGESDVFIPLSTERPMHEVYYAKPGIKSILLYKKVTYTFRKRRKKSIHSKK